MGQLRQTVGFSVSICLAFSMGYLIILIIRNQVWLKENVPIPNVTNNLITAIKLFIPKLIPPIVKLEKRMDTSVIMETMITRIFLCQVWLPSRLGADTPRPTSSCWHHSAPRSRLTRCTAPPYYRLFRLA